MGSGDGPLSAANLGDPPAAACNLFPGKERALTSMPLTDTERSDLGRIGIATRLATESTTEMTAAARQVANYDRYYSQTDPSLPEPERHRRALALRDAHMAKMRLARQVAQRKATEAAQRAQLAEQAEREAAGQ